MSSRVMGKSGRLLQSHLFNYALIGLMLILSTCSTVNAPPSRLKVANQHIKHIVFFIKENRTFDNYFGTYPYANGAITATDSEGQVVLLQHESDQVPDINHSAQAARKAYDNGKIPIISIQWRLRLGEPSIILSPIKTLEHWATLRKVGDAMFLTS